VQDLHRPSPSASQKIKLVKCDVVKSMNPATPFPSCLAWCPH